MGSGLAAKAVKRRKERRLIPAEAEATGETSGEAEGANAQTPALKPHQSWPQA